MSIKHPAFMVAAATLMLAGCDKATQQEKIVSDIRDRFETSCQYVNGVTVRELSEKPHVREYLGLEDAWKAYIDRKGGVDPSHANDRAVYIHEFGDVWARLTEERNARLAKAGFSSVGFRWECRAEDKRNDGFLDLSSRKMIKANSN